SLRRDRGHLHRRPRGRDRGRADQDREREPYRSRREVQPAAPHRGEARRRRTLPRAGDLKMSERRRRLLRRAPLALVLAVALYYAVLGGEYSAFDLLDLRARQAAEAER